MLLLQAADDCSEAILLASGAGPSDSVPLASAHMLRGYISEQLERYVASCEDYRLARSLGCLQVSACVQQPQMRRISLLLLCGPGLEPGEQCCMLSITTKT